jgi:hypothetical protein
MKALGVAMLLLASVASSIANASIIINTDQSASGSLGTVDFTNGTGMLVTGVTDGATVEFQGTESLVSNGGQSRITAENDALFTDLTISIPGFTFDRLVFRLFNPAADGTVNIEATDDGGNVFQQILPLTGVSGEFFNVQSDNVQQISSVSFTSSAGVQDIRQVRVGGLSEEGGAPPEIPEPGTMALLCSGLLVVGCRNRLTKFLLRQ